VALSPRNASICASCGEAIRPGLDAANAANAASFASLMRRFTANFTVVAILI
jgi:hypothetical protein